MKTKYKVKTLLTNMKYNGSDKYYKNTINTK